MQPIRWAIFGSGAVAGKFALALKALPGAALTLVASRTEGRAEAFARTFGVGEGRTGYAIRPQDPVDIVYVATPPSEHVAQALAAIRAGKAVLVEKPFASSAAGARAIIDAASQARVFSMEGMWTRFLPALAAAREALAAGAIGEVRAAWGSFAVSQEVNPASSLFDPASGGGALGDRGAYPISLALDLLGPARLGGAWARIGQTGVDEDVSATLVHESGAATHIYAGLRSHADNGFLILGDRGRLKLRGPIYRPFGIEITPVRPRGREAFGAGLKDRLKETAAAQRLRALVAPLIGRTRGRAAPYAGNGYGYEAQAAIEAMRRGELEHPRMPLGATLAAAELMDQIKAAWQA